MSNELATNRDAILERVIIHGDLARLTSQERVNYYRLLCESLHLNPLLKPFDFIQTKQGLKIYANRNCAMQLGSQWKITFTKIEREIVNDTCIVTAYVKSGLDGREDSDIGAVSLAGLKSEDYANAIKKAVTQAKRRAILSLCGIGIPDESDTSNTIQSHIPEPEDIVTHLINLHGAEAVISVLGKLPENLAEVEQVAVALEGQEEIINGSTVESE